MKKNKFLAWLLIVAVFITTFSTSVIPAQANGASSTLKGYVTVAVEKFTVGQGYIKEPIKVPIYEGDNGASLITRALGDGNYRYLGNIDSGFYLSEVKDSGRSEVNIPQYILDMISADGNTVGTKADPEWLSQFDYTSMSGWMYAVNNVFPPFGMTDYKPQDGDIIRTQFTTYGYGSDLGGCGEIPVQLANKDALTAEIAEINSDPNKETILDRPVVQSAVYQAYSVLENMASSQISVDHALVGLNHALDIEPPVITVSGIQDKQEVSNKDISFKVAVTDNVYSDIIPEVKLNGVTLSPANGEYKASLNSGSNAITVTALDGAGNKTNVTYQVTYKLETTVAVKQQLNKSLAYILNTVKNPSFGTGSGEWSILSLARANYTVPNGYYDLYYNNVATKIASIIKEDGKLDANKSTENSRAILGLTSIGKDITNVAGYDLRKALADYQYIQKQGNNGPIFALIALDSHNYEIPVVDGVTEQTTREKLVQYILDKEVKKGTAQAGGWALGVTKADIDMTAMAMQALAPYYATRDDVKAAVDRAIQWLSDNQNNQGGFTSWGSTSSESISQVIVALTGVGVDPHTDARFVKSGNSLIDALLSFAAPEGGFKHILTGKVDNMATDQGTYALVSYDRLINHSSRLFDMNDVKVEQPEEPGPGQPEGPKEFPLPSGENPKVEIPNDANDYIVPISTGDSNKEITVAIPEGNQSKVSVNLPSNSDLPQIEAIKGNVSVVIPKGAKVTSGDASAIELISALTGGESALKDSVNQIIPGDKKLDNILQTFSMGGSARVEFSQFITLTFKDLKGKDAAYIQNGTPHAIQKFASDDLGFASGKSEYAYDSGNDLIVKTNHFTDYIAYASSAVQTPGGDGGNGNGEGNGSGNGEGNGSNNGGGTTPSKPYVILSVDKLTINKGYVVPSVQVELQSGDTVWSVLKRVLDSRGIDYRDSWNSDFGSVYVESIAGDGEFDHGSGSGWMYNVNGKYPNYGASSYDLSAGDRIQWRYTTNLGVDLNAPIPTMSPTPTPKPGATPAPGGGANPEGSGDPNVSPSPTVTPKDPTQNTNDIKQLYTDADKISSWAYSAIETATVKGYIQGNNGQVNPKAYITRAEFTKILVSALELDIKSDKGITYKDVALGDWFYPYVNAAHKAGLITGFNNEFKPNDKITREQMAAIIVRALAIPATKPGTAIKDINTVSAWAKADVETVVATGLMLGDDNQFKPKELVTREMAAVVATRTHDYKSGNKVVSPTIQNTAVSSYIQNTAAFLQKTVTNPVISSVGGDWTVFGLARSGVKVPDSYYTKYYANVEATLKEKSGKLHSVKYTEYDRVILALTSINKNIDKVAGYNLLEPLADFDTVIKQGINGPVFALIALDSNHYDIPVVKDVKTQTTREMLIDYILGREISGGGWALGSNATAADPDITGMVIQGLTPYYKTNAKVTAAVDRGIAWLSKTQTADGGFASWESTNSESIAQVIVALTGLGIDPHKDSRFIKNGHSAVDALLSFAAPEGGFYHVKQGGVGNGGAQPGEVDLMATDQAMYALVSYDRLVNGQTRLYDMTDVK
ncbi:S-layer protein [Paenibacillus odorifer]|uniref:S-layer homology domain-containing protein n=1 Tax=Paenibacillus odorifer TaxID=189426 RepID=UPI00096D44EA|nr:S-layer homology domain-containing protein [Paenibacillus odorifer]OME30856.1 S-layer protein [Paenibacillus odorifer]